MLKSIFKPLEKPNGPTYFQQKIIEDTEEIPEGWTEDFKDLDLPEDEPTETERMQQQIADLQEIVSDISGGGF